MPHKEAERLQMENKTLLDIISKILAKDYFLNESFEEDQVSSGYSSLKSSPNSYKYSNDGGFQPMIFGQPSAHHQQLLPFQPLLQENPTPRVVDQAMNRTTPDQRGPVKYYGSGRFCRKPIISALV